LANWQILDVDTLGAYVFNSPDNGVTWNLISRLWDTGNPSGVGKVNEIAFTMVGSVVYALGRTSPTDAIAKSLDNGVTWMYASILMPYPSKGASLTTLEDGLMVVHSGHYPNTYLVDPVDMSFVPNSEFHFDSDVYGTIRKYKDKYAASGFRVDDVRFHQFKYYPLTKKFGYNHDPPFVNTSVMKNLSIDAVNGLDISLKSLITTQDLTYKLALKWRVYNNGVLFKEFGSWYANDGDVELPFSTPILTFPIQASVNYLFTITSIDDDGAESAQSTNLAYILP
ncbi:MAG: hypothetical protein GXP30_15285, partial [Verrucomicrobia bacterium]|nr:hypothetical protein [Verrucomicrobiota bacterium]